MGKYGILAAIWIFLYQMSLGIDLIIITLFLGAITVYFLWKDKELIKKELKEVKNRFEGSFWIILIIGLAVASILILIMKFLGVLEN